MDHDKLKHPRYDDDVRIYWRRWAMEQAVLLHKDKGYPHIDVDFNARASLVATADTIYQWTVLKDNGRSRTHTCEER